MRLSPPSVMVSSSPREVRRRGQGFGTSPDAINFFLTVRYKPKESGQGDQVANTHRTGDLSFETGRCASWYRALQTGRSLSIDVTYLSTLARR